MSHPNFPTASDGRRMHPTAAHRPTDKESTDMSHRSTPRHLRPVLDRTTPRPSDIALAWRTVHGDRHWPSATRAQARAVEHAHLDDLFTTRPVPAVAFGGAA